MTSRCTSRLAGSVANNNLGDGGSPLLASLRPNAYYSPASIGFDAAGNMFLPQSGANRVRETIPGRLGLRLSASRVDFQNDAPRSQTAQVLTNVSEPFPFALQVSGGGSWLNVNRITGQTGDTLTISTNSAGLAAGVYTAAVQISVPNTTAAPVTLPVTLTAQAGLRVQ
jgi:hypothetical protein